MSMRYTILLCMLIFVGFGAAPAQAFPGYFPECDDPWVAQKVRVKFNTSQRYGWNAGPGIVSIRHRTVRSVEIRGHNPILRRFCRATATLSDGDRRNVHYLIEQQMGFAGTTYRVEFCVDGRDPWRVYNGFCRVLRR